MAKVSELLRVLKADGWYLYRHGKKHDLYRHSTKENELQVPRHPGKEMANGTYLSLLKAAGLK